MHPEFGYLWLSTNARRTLRVALAAAMCGIAVGTVATRPLVPIDRSHAGSATIKSRSGDAQASPSLRTAAEAPPGNRAGSPDWQASKFAPVSGTTTAAVGASSYAAPKLADAVQPYGSGVFPSLVPPLSGAAYPSSGTSTTGERASATLKRHQRIAKARPLKRPRDGEHGYSSYRPPNRSASRDTREALQSAPGWGW